VQKYKEKMEYANFGGEKEIFSGKSGISGPLR